jgi:hypothetical protein
MRERLALWALVLGFASLPAVLLMGWFALGVALLGLGGFALTGFAALRERSAGIPPLPPGLRSAACAACDQAMLGLMQARIRLPDLAEMQLLASELESGLPLWRGGAPDPLERRPPALLDPQLTPLRFRGESFAELSAESGWAPPSSEPGSARWLAREANRKLRATVLQHPGPPRPWLICLHGYRMGQPEMDLVLFDPVRLHHRLGLNLVVPVLPLHGKRRAGARSGDYFLDGRLVETRHALCQSVWELRRLVGWVRAQGAPAVGVYGVSLGALSAALLASVEPDLDLLLLGIPLADAADVLWRHAPPGPLRALQQAGVSRAKVDECLEAVNPLVRAPKLPAERITLYAASGDQIVPPQHAVWLHERWGRPRLEWLAGGHLTFFSDRRFRCIEADALSALHA